MKVCTQLIQVEFEKVAVLNGDPRKSSFLQQKLQQLWQVLPNLKKASRQI